MYESVDTQMHTQTDRRQLESHPISSPCLAFGSGELKWGVNYTGDLKGYMSLVLRKQVFGVSDQVRAVRPQKIARSLKFQI